jgi:membrane associated rhomboid family serine protease
MLFQQHSSGNSMVQLKQILLVVSSGTVLIWGVSLYGFANAEVVSALALVPRNSDGLIGILTMPLVHGSPTHLMLNTPLFAVMSAGVVMGGLRYFFSATLLILAIAGVLLWGFGRDGLHIGASGLIFGYFGLLLTRGLFERRFWPIVGSLGVGALYAGLLWGIVPTDNGVSWEAHLTGLLGGIVTARLLAGRLQARRSPDGHLPAKRGG